MQEDNISDTTESLTTEGLEQAFLLSVRHASRAVGELGNKGKAKLDRVNRFGDIPIQADIVAEECVIHALTAEGIHAQIISEEHGNVTLGKETPDTLVLLDGIDGSSQFSQETGRSGTIVGAFSKLSPTFGESVVSVITLYPSQEQYYATAKGAFVLAADGSPKPIHTAHIQTLAEIGELPICVDMTLAIPRDLANTKLRGFTLNIHDATVAHYADVASGRAAAFIGDRRKDDIELAASFRLLKTAGATIIDLQTGEEIDTETYKQIDKEVQNRPYIIAATKALARELAERLQG